jgi:ferredoxin
MTRVFPDGRTTHDLADGQGELAVRIHVNMTRCTGMGWCESLAPEYFSVQEEGYVSVTDAVLPDSDLETLTRAVKACPAKALSLVEENG